MESIMILARILLLPHRHTSNQPPFRQSPPLFAPSQTRLLLQRLHTVYASFPLASSYSSGCNC